MGFFKIFMTLKTVFMAGFSESDKRGGSINILRRVSVKKFS